MRDYLFSKLWLCLLTGHYWLNRYVRDLVRLVMIRMSSICLLAALLLVTSTSYAEPIGGYFREDQNVGRVDRTIGQIEGLLFRVRSDAGLTVDENGAVTGWADQSGNGVEFTALPGAEEPVRPVENAIGAKPGLRFKAARRRPGGLRSGPVSIDPAKGLTLAVLARVSGVSHIGHLLCYGGQWRTGGSMGVSLRAKSAYGRCWWRTSVGSEAVLESTDDNVAGKGFVLFVARYDPQVGEVSMYQNGVRVGRAACEESLAEKHVFGIGVDPRGQWSFGGEVVEALAFNNALGEEDLRVLHRRILARYDLGGGPVSSMAHKLPYAYYPSRNRMEVAIELSPELLRKAGTKPEKVQVRILDSETERQVATGTVPLDGQYRGQSLFAVPDLADGKYAVEYLIGDHVERSPEIFERIHFPFEETSYGETHEVYPPFEPVEVEGNTVAVVGRSYAINELGLFDSAVSLDRELLAAPMRLVARTAEGEELDWAGGEVAARAEHPGEAVFHTRAHAGNVVLDSEVVVQEDGCAKIEMTFTPRRSTPDTRHAPPDTRHPTRPTLSSLHLDIPLKDSEVPLFHYVADNGMRFNYAGRTPRGGEIEWYREEWDRWVPQRWRVVQPGPDDGVIWTAADTRQHGNVQRWDHRPFVPYLWLGAEKRGLAFFMENEVGCATDYRTPIQKVIREGDRVILRVEIFQRPVTLREPRTVTFGLMAGPGKPMEKEFRTRTFAGGVGPVSCWGGWQCASKYPTGRDWSIVDRIQEIRRRGDFTEEDEKWFQAKYQEVRQRWPERKINGSTDWLWLTRHFARRAASRGRSHSGTYFEEHATDPRIPEWEVFQDEWASHEFNRFRNKPANWGVFSPSYQDFVLYMANEWMQRGVSLYFDNTNPKRCYNARFGPAFRGPDGALRYGISIFAQREYYRRIYKLLSRWNDRGAPYPIDFTLHITNTQTLPFNTWATATLDLEQRSYTLDPEKFPAEVEGMKGGYRLPWPPDYTRAVTFGRQVGTIPLALNFVSGHSRHKSNEFTPEMMLRNWAMCRIHGIRPQRLWAKPSVLAREYEKALKEFGYGDIDRIDHHNYWAEDPFFSVSDDRIKWLALTPHTRHATPETMGLVLLQSYSRTEAVTATVKFPGATAFEDIRTGETLEATDGHAQIRLPENFGTRMFRVRRGGESGGPQRE